MTEENFYNATITENPIYCYQAENNINTILNKDGCISEVEKSLFLKSIKFFLSNTLFKPSIKRVFLMANISNPNKANKQRLYRLLKDNAEVLTTRTTSINWKKLSNGSLIKGLCSKTTRYINAVY